MHIIERPVPARVYCVNMNKVLITILQRASFDQYQIKTAWYIRNNKAQKIVSTNISEIVVFLFKGQQRTSDTWFRSPIQLLGLEKDHCNLSPKAKEQETVTFIYCKRRLKSTTALTPSLSYMTVMLHMIYTFKCMYCALWSMKYWCTIKPIKTRKSGV